MVEGEKRKKSTIVFVVCSIVFVVLFAIINLNAVTGVVSAFLSLLSPVLIGFAIAYMLNPILKLFEFKIYKKIPKKNLLRSLSIISTYIVGLLIVVAFLWLLIPSLITSIVDLVGKYDTYIVTTTNFVNGIINKFLSNETTSESINPADVEALITRFFAASGDIFETITKYVFEYGTGLFVGVKNVVLGLFISIYMLISKEKLQAQIRKFGVAVLPESKNRRIIKYIRLTHKTFSGFFIGKIIDSAIILLITLVAMLLFRLEYALLISVIVGVTNIIPIFGPLIGAIPSFFILFIVEPKQALIFLVLIILIQQLDGNVIGPKILGDSIGISSLSVIIAIVIMGDLFGVLGMIVGVPIFAVVITIVKELIETRLKKKGKSIDTADYYAKDSLVDPNEHHEHAAKKIFDNIENSVKKIINALKKVIDNLKKSKKSKDGTVEEKTEETTAEEMTENNTELEDTAVSEADNEEDREN